MKSNNIIKSHKDGVFFLKKNHSNGEEFRILCFSDTHFGNKFQLETKELLRDIIVRTEPNLIIITGDVVIDDNNLASATELISFLESFQVLFSITLGNHESEGNNCISRKELIELFAKSPYAVLDANVSPDLYGYGNTIINITDPEDNPLFTLFLLDSGDYISNNTKKTLGIKGGSYDFIKDNQIKWYQDKILQISRQQGLANNVHISSMAFFHIPLIEEILAITDGTKISGTILEKPEVSKYNSGFFDKIIEMQSTKAIFFGHDHVNDLISYYKGVYLCYIQSSGYNTYGYKKRQLDRRGGTLITIGCNKQFSIDPIIYKK